MPTDSNSISLNRNTARTWLALKRLSQKLVHDNNNIFGALQGYISLLELSPDGSEALPKYLPSMQEALDSGMVRTKALSTYYRLTQVMKIEADPHALASAAVEQFAATNGFEVALDSTADLSSLRLDEPAFSKIILLLCHLLMAADSADPSIVMSKQNLSSEELDQYVMESAAGDYLCLTVRADTGQLHTEPDLIFEPFQMPIDGDGYLGMAEILSIISNHEGNLDLQMEQEQLTLNIFFPYQSV